MPRAARWTLRLAACVLVVFILLAGMLVVRYYDMYRSRSVFGQPAEMHMLGTQFLDDGLTIPFSRITRYDTGTVRRVGSTQPFPLVDWGRRPVYVVFSDGCPNGAAIKMGPDSYLLYDRGGGC